MKKEYQEASTEYIIRWIIIVPIVSLLTIFILNDIPEQTITDIKNVFFGIILYAIGNISTILLIINTILLAKILKKIKN